MTTIRVLGCSGGIGDGRHTTSFGVDKDVLIDAGSGVLSLSRAALMRIDYVLLTHAHLDHVLALPLLIDGVGEGREKPVTVYALPAVIEMLKRHLFNNHLWPDFSRIPSVTSPFMRFEPIEVGQSLELSGRVFTAHTARHSVAACSWEVAAANGVRWLFSGDTAGDPAFWQHAAGYGAADHVIVETSFSDAQAGLANVSGHYHPAALARDWRSSGCSCQLWISHLKPGAETDILHELEQSLGFPMRALQAGQVFVLDDDA